MLKRARISRHNRYNINYVKTTIEQFHIGNILEHLKSEHDVDVLKLHDDDKEKRIKTFEVSISLLSVY